MKKLLIGVTFLISACSYATTVTSNFDSNRLSAINALLESMGEETIKQESDLERTCREGNSQSFTHETCELRIVGNTTYPQGIFSALTSKGYSIYIISEEDEEKYPRQNGELYLSYGWSNLHSWERDAAIKEFREERPPLLHTTYSLSGLYEIPENIKKKGWSCVFKNLKSCTLKN